MRLRQTRDNRNNYGAVAFAFPFEYVPLEGKGTRSGEASFRLRLELGREDLGCSVME
jgi:hypothetical protein